MQHDNKLLVTTALLLSLVVGCGASAEQEGYRDGRGPVEGGKANVGAGFTLDPACDYVCDATNDNEAVEAAGSLSSFCPDDFPDEELGRLTCELTYSIPSGHPSDCVAAFSEATCDAALDVCLDGL